MNCSEFEIHLDEQMAPPRLVETPDMAEHAAQCDHCRTRLEQFRQLGEALELWRDEIPDVELAPAVVAAASAAQPPAPAAATAALRRRANGSRAPAPAQQAGIISRPVPPPFRISRAGGLAAACVAAGIVAAILISRPGNDPSDALSRPQIAANPVPQAIVPTPKQEEDSRPAAPARDRDLLPAPQAAVYHDLAQKAAGALSDVSAIVTSGSFSQSADRASATENNEGWMDDLERQLQPIGRGLDDAFDFLWQAGQLADPSQS
jgi:hypothetical protein